MTSAGGTEEASIEAAEMSLVYTDPTRATDEIGGLAGRVLMSLNEQPTEFSIAVGARAPWAGSLLGCVHVMADSFCYYPPIGWSGALGMAPPPELEMLLDRLRALADLGGKSDKADAAVELLDGILLNARVAFVSFQAALPPAFSEDLESQGAAFSRWAEASRARRQVDELETSGAAQQVRDVRRLAENAWERLSVPGDDGLADPVAVSLFHMACGTTIEISQQAWAVDRDSKRNGVAMTLENLAEGLPRVGTALDADDVYPLLADLWIALDGWVGTTTGHIAGTVRPGLADNPLATKLWDRVEAVSAITGTLKVKEADRNEVRDREERENQRQRDALEKARVKYESAMDAQNALKAAFQQMSDDEAGTANQLRLLVFYTLTGLAVMAIAIALIFARQTGISTWTSVATHLGVSIPVLGLAGYLAKESAQHRRISRWAGVMAVQLATIRNYVEPLEKDQARELMKAFGDRVLGELPPDTKNESDSGNLTTALDIIQRFATQRGA
ncbi:hypothetical protein [Nocardioides alkalitolerans]|uniref:hypothetical protein n=1 Tax=Nocardioides alkalitolerans TaxID=281714 RepID=UPI0012FCC1A0|nr:hypothetical protein [Nocardioides alkalitolerans]